MNKLVKAGIIAVLLFTVLMLVGGCLPTGTEDQPQDDNSTWYLIGFLVLIFAMFYFVMIRPQRRRQKEHEQMMQELQKGDRVITAGGLYGTVDSVSDDSIVIKVESGASIRVSRSSVAVRQER